MAVRDLLERFRPAGAPGAAAPAAVPSDRFAVLADELRPVLALLSDVEQTCERLRGDADGLAERMRADAAAQSVAMASAARTEADAARTEAAARQRQRSRELADDEQRRAQASVAAVRQAQREHSDVLVARVAGAVRAELTAPPTGAEHGAGR